MTKISSTIDKIQIKLKVKRLTEKAWLIKKDYAKLESNVIDENNNNPASHFIIYRLGYYQNNQCDSSRCHQTDHCESYRSEIASIPASQLLNGSFTYIDSPLDQNKEYIYIITAVSEDGEILAYSNLVTI